MNPDQQRRLDHLLHQLQFMMFLLILFFGISLVAVSIQRAHDADMIRGGVENNAMLLRRIEAELKAVLKPESAVNTPKESQP